MERRVLFATGALLAGAALMPAPAEARSRAVPARSAGGVPADVAARLSPARGKRAVHRLGNVAQVPVWRPKSLPVPERYQDAYLSATDNRGTFYGFQERVHTGGDGDVLLVVRGESVVEVPVPNYRRTFRAPRTGTVRW